MPKQDQSANIETDRWFLKEIIPLEAELDRFLQRHWRRADEIDDLRQEVLVRIYKSALDVAPSNPRAFLYRIARNLMIDKIRKSSIVTMDSVMDFESLSVSSNEADPFEATSSRQELRMLQDALDELPERTRDVVFMRRVQGYSQKETARRLNISEPTVERHVARAVRQLTSYFRKNGVVRTAQIQRTSKARQNESG